MASAASMLASKTPPHAVLTDNPADLSRIYESDVNLCVLQRRITACLAGFVLRLLSGSRSCETEVRVDGGRPGVERLLPDDLHAMPGAEVWFGDVEHLVALFRDLFGAASIGLRLHILEKPMCPRFHVDHVPVRLVCTYGGPGTEWLPETAVNRAKLGHGSGGLPDEESGLILDPAAVSSLPPYAVGLLKGETWEGNEGRGAVHRSPKLPAEQPRRLLLTLDWV